MIRDIGAPFVVQMVQCGSHTAVSEQSNQAVILIAHGNRSDWSVRSYLLRLSALTNRGATLLIKAPCISLDMRKLSHHEERVARVLLVLKDMNRTN